MSRPVRPILISSLEDIAEVLDSIPNPFGTFEKAKYVLCGYRNDMRYSCITTCRSEENMLSYLKEKASDLCLRKQNSFVMIIKIQNGKEKELFKGNIFRYGRKKGLPKMGMAI